MPRDVYLAEPKDYLKDDVRVERLVSWWAEKRAYSMAYELVEWRADLKVYLLAEKMVGKKVGMRGFLTAEMMAGLMVERLEQKTAGKMVDKSAVS